MKLGDLRGVVELVPDAVRLLHVPEPGIDHVLQELVAVDAIRDLLGKRQARQPVGLMGRGEVHLADCLRPVAHPLGHRGERARVRRQHVPVVEDAVAVREPSRHHRRSRGHADRRLCVGQVEGGPVRDQRIQVRSAHQRMPVRTDRVPAQLIAHDDQDVRRVRCGCGSEHEGSPFAWSVERLLG